MAAATYLLFPPVTRAAPELLARRRPALRRLRHLGPAALFVALPIVVACEEIVWRGVIYGALVDRVPWPLAVIAGTALYAIAHAPIGSTALVLACLGAGICWNTLRYETGSLAAVFVAHMVWDAALLVFGRWLGRASSDRTPSPARSGDSGANLRMARRRRSFRLRGGLPSGGSMAGFEATEEVWRFLERHHNVGVGGDISAAREKVVPRAKSRGAMRAGWYAPQQRVGMLSIDSACRVAATDRQHGEPARTWRKQAWLGTWKRRSVHRGR